MQPETFTRELRDRRDAGRRLGRQLASLARERPVVLGLPRGGVPVAFEVARALDAPLDVLITRKIGAPGDPEYGIGAGAEGGARTLDAESIRWLAVSPEALEHATSRAEREIAQGVRAYRDGRSRRRARPHGRRG